MPDKVVFEDGASYEREMGTWSRLAGDVFLDWLRPAPGLRWIDIGCGNGAFTELIVQRCAPTNVHGIDPSEPQIAYARTRPAGRLAEFQCGDAMNLPFAAATFDAAVMALVIFFVPEPSGAVEEMVRVVAPGGTVAAYAWDLPGGGSPLAPINIEIKAMGMNPSMPPHAEVSPIGALRDLWVGAGLAAVETQEIVVQRTFSDFDDFWTTCMNSSIGRRIIRLPAADIAKLKGAVRKRLPPDTSGQITYSARANAVKGRVPP